eukprot:CAMPEP_0204578406 /NCGR_PEP_ID=MMETSP0661-20131031/42893_1 /ASSEMBLY_ACC=CAM_ASM_000606 /TAXON_ID=109239 /ORGANISM="Alexandrium margalefi, Strain AMGDE01CS-322" /LENGTH=222 /DNA_ID=CAMNT_0051587335 /DNA_START=74 /DNA_END=742 /DNA_ORIENTATION=+
MASRGGAGTRALLWLSIGVGALVGLWPASPPARGHSCRLAGAFSCQEPAAARQGAFRSLPCSLTRSTPRASHRCVRGTATSLARAPLVFASAEGPSVAGMVGDAFNQAADSLGLSDMGLIEEGEQWRALTKIKIRTSPSINAAQLDDRVIESGEVFVVAEKLRAKVPTEGRNRLYLRVAGTEGWVFDTGAAGSWYGREIATPVYEDEEGGDSPFGAIGSMFR